MRRAWCSKRQEKLFSIADIDKRLKKLSEYGLKVQKKRKTNKTKRAKEYKFELETIEAFYPAKHGHAYVAFLKKENGKITRKFVEHTGRLWDSKYKYYQTSFIFKAKEGDIIEARLTSGSWKNDYKDYYVVKNGKLKLISREEAFQLLKKAT